MIPKRDDCSIPSLPEITTWRPSLIQTNDEEIIMCGGKNSMHKCLSLESEGWSDHSLLTEERCHASAIVMPNGTYIFGGYDVPKTWEWLPRGSTIWQKGGEIPGPGHHYGCGLSISDTELVLIGGENSRNTILMFNIITNQWSSMDQALQEGRAHHACVKVQNEILVSGGMDPLGNVLATTELIDMTTLSSKSGPSMISVRFNHGLALAHYNDQLTALAFGGAYWDDQYNQWKQLDTIETWDLESETWIMLDDKLAESKQEMAYISVPTRLVCKP